MEPFSLFNPLHSNHQYTYSLYCYQYISKGTDKENFLNNQEYLWLVIISFKLVTLISDAGVACKEKLDSSH